MAERLNPYVGIFRFLGCFSTLPHRQKFKNLAGQSLTTTVSEVWRKFGWIWLPRFWEFLLNKKKEKHYENRMSVLARHNNVSPSIIDLVSSTRHGPCVAHQSFTVTLLATTDPVFDHRGPSVWVSQPVCGPTLTKCLPISHGARACLPIMEHLMARRRVHPSMYHVFVHHVLCDCQAVYFRT